MSMMYLLTLGGVGNRLEHAVDRLRHPDLAPMSRPVVDLGLADPARAAAVGGRRQGRGAAAVAGQAPRRTERLRRAQAPRRPVPSLPTTLRQRRCRPADTTPAAAQPPVFVPPPAVRVEEELFDVADGYRPLIAVGKPGGGRETPGGVAYRDYLDDAAWQDYVADKIRRAERIVLVMKNSAGVRWEIARVVAEGAAPKTLFLFDPTLNDAAERATLAHMLVPLLRWRRRRAGPRVLGSDDRLLFPRRRAGRDRQPQPHGDVVPDRVLALPRRDLRIGPTCAADRLQLLAGRPLDAARARPSSRW